MTINKGIEVTLKGVIKANNWLKKQKENSEKAMNLALRTEGFDLMKALRKDITAGSPGGRRFAPLSFISLKTGHRRSSTKTALKGLPYGVRYDVKKASIFQNYQFKFGFIGGPERVHGFFRNIAKEHSEGFSRTITKKQRRFFKYEGLRKLGWKGKGKGYTEKYEDNVELMRAAGEHPFFLRRTTRIFRTPARPIISPFWQAHKSEAMKNIKQKYALKLSGTRI